MKASLTYLPEKYQSKELYQIVTELIDYTLEQREQEIADIQNKWTDPTKLSEDAAKMIINDFGYGYLTDILLQLTRSEINNIIEYMSMVHMMKGHRKGLEMIMKLLGFSYEITEWWEDDGTTVLPDGKYLSSIANAFKMTIYMDTSYVKDVYRCIELLKKFITKYIYAKWYLFTFFIIGDADKNLVCAGFTDQIRTLEVSAVLGVYNKQIFTIDSEINSIVVTTFSINSFTPIDIIYNRQLLIPTIDYTIGVNIINFNRNLYGTIENPSSLVVKKYYR